MRFGSVGICMPQSALSRSPGGSLEAQPAPVTVCVRRRAFLSVISLTSKNVMQGLTVTQRVEKRLPGNASNRGYHIDRLPIGQIGKCDIYRGFSTDFPIEGLAYPVNPKPFGPESGQMKGRNPAATGATDGGGSVAERTCRSLLGAAHSILDKSERAYPVQEIFPVPGFSRPSFLLLSGYSRKWVSLG